MKVQLNISFGSLYYVLFVINQLNEHKPEALESTNLGKSTNRNLKKGIGFESWKRKDHDFGASAGYIGSSRIA